MWSPHILSISLVLFCLVVSQPSIEDFLSLGDEALSKDLNEKAISYYEKGVQLLKNSENDDDESLVVILSIHTNYGSALSAIGKNEEAAEQYQQALQKYSKDIDDIVEESDQKDATAIAAQASFFLGMVYQDLGQFRDSVDAYSMAHQLDPFHWASVANLAAVYHDGLSDHRKALTAYNVAYEILTQKEVEPTDAPGEPRFILSQLQYRIGLCISHDLDQKCAVADAPDTPVDCKQLATHAFAQAIEYDPDNEVRKIKLSNNIPFFEIPKLRIALFWTFVSVGKAHACYYHGWCHHESSIQHLRQITVWWLCPKVRTDTLSAIASWRDTVVNICKFLLWNSFEHSLVQELRYTGYERLRKAFDRAFDNNPPTFSKVIDAGCGTGLVGEQFRNASKHLIGVDLSEAIILEAQKARPGLYDEVRVGDVTEVFRAEAPISMIVAADSYIYFGDLEPLFQSMEESLENHGYVSFTLENVSEDDEERYVRWFALGCKLVRRDKQLT